MSVALELASLIRNNFSKVPIVTGGFGPTFYPRDFLENNFDYVVRGEAESTVVDLYHYIYSGNPSRESIKGLCFKKNNKAVISEPAAPLVELDELPFPARDTTALAYSRKAPVNIVTSRGCQAHCIFCSIASMQKLQRTKWRFRSIENILKELSLLVKQGYRYFKFVDDSFIEPPRDENWCQVFTEKILELKTPIRIRSSIRADRVNEKILKSLKQAGFFSFSCGIESGSPLALKRMGKSASLKDNERALSLFKEHDYIVQMGLILFDHHTTFSELVENFYFLKKYDWVVVKGIFSEMYAAEGTPFTNLLRKKKVILNSSANEDGNVKYKLKDCFVRKCYENLKLWQLSQSKLYDQIIDPISAPKAVEPLILRKFYDLYREVHKADLIFFEKLLKKISLKENDVLEWTKQEICNSKKFRNDKKIQVDFLYEQNELSYQAVKNPFLC